MLTRRRALALGAALVAAPALAQANRTLRFAWWGGATRHAATLKAAALFEARNPGVKVKCEYMGFYGYLERLTAQVAGGSEPDVMQINWAWLAMFSKRGTGFKDLRAFENVLPLDQFSHDDLQSGQVAGRLNALPVSFTARIFLWNQSTFARAGLGLPRTWDELFATGEAFQRELGDRHYPIDGEMYDMLLLAHAYMLQRTGMHYIHPTSGQVGMTHEVARQWVATYRQLVARRVCTPLRLRASLGGAEKPTEQQHDWTLGHWAGNYVWDQQIFQRASTIKPPQQLAVGDFPTLPGAVNSGMFGRPGLMYCVGRNSRQPDLAARLVGQLLGDAETGKLLGRTRGVPCARVPFEALVKGGLLPALEVRAHEQIEKQRSAGRIDRPSPLLEHARIHRLMREVFETVAYDKSTEAEAARRLVEEGNALLKRIR